MRITSIIAFCLSFLGMGEAVQFAELLRFKTTSATRLDVLSDQEPGIYAHAMTQAVDSPSMQKLDLRQAVPVTAATSARVSTALSQVVSTATVVAPAKPPAIAPGVAPIAPLAVPPGFVPAITPPPIAPVPPAPAAAPPNEPGVSITVQWVETWIGGTSRTWLPHTITLRNAALSEAAPPPGKGKVGMGTLTGRVGVTKTVIEGAAKTVGPEWKVGAMAVVGMGIAGMV